jgi:hypothetical protein
VRRPDNASLRAVRGQPLQLRLQRCQHSVTLSWRLLCCLSPCARRAEGDRRATVLVTVHGGGGAVPVNRRRI